MSKYFGVTHLTEDDLKEEGFKSLGHNVRIAKSCTIIGAENISLGNNVRIDGYCTLAAVGDGYINLGSYIHISGNCSLLGGAGIIMDDFTALSWGSRIFSKSDDYSGKFMTNPMVPEKFTGGSEGLVRLFKHVIVGANTVILPKVSIGEGVAVGALSLVHKSLDEWGVYSGIPAKKIKERSKELLSHEEMLLEE